MEESIPEQLNRIEGKLDKIWKFINPIVPIDKQLRAGLLSVLAGKLPNNKLPRQQPRPDPWLRNKVKKELSKGLTPEELEARDTIPEPKGGIAQRDKLEEGETTPQPSSLPCSSCKYCKEGKLDPTDEVSSVYCKKLKRAINSYHLVENKPNWCPLNTTSSDKTN